MANLGSNPGIVEIIIEYIHSAIEENGVLYPTEIKQSAAVQALSHTAVEKRVESNCCLSSGAER